MQPLNGKKTKFKNTSRVRHQRSEGMSRRSNGTSNLQGNRPPIQANNIDWIASALQFTTRGK